MDVLIATAGGPPQNNSSDRRSPGCLLGAPGADQLACAAMDRRQLMGAGAVLLGTGAVGYALFAPVNDRELVAELLDELASTLSFSEPIGNVVFRGSHLSERFKELFVEQIQIRVSEVHGDIPSHRGKLGIAAAQALARYGSLDVSFGIDDMKIQGDSAEIQATATVMGTYGGEMKRDTRPVMFTAVKISGEWRIQTAFVSAPQ